MANVPNTLDFALKQLLAFNQVFCFDYIVPSTTKHDFVTDPLNAVRNAEDWFELDNAIWMTAAAFAAEIRGYPHRYGAGA